jgi:hypothetical protein
MMIESGEQGRRGMPLAVAVRALCEMINVYRAEARVLPCPKARAFAKAKKKECSEALLHLYWLRENGGAANKEKEKVEPAYMPPRRNPWTMWGGEIK